MNQKQVDWTPPGVAFSIGSILSHLVTFLDVFVREIYLGGRFAFLITPTPQKIIMREVQADLRHLHARKKQVITITGDC